MNIKFSENLKKRAFVILLIILFGWVSYAYSNDKTDTNVTQEEMAKFNDKYLKGKLTPSQDGKVSELIKLSDIAKQKNDANITMQSIETNLTKSISIDSQNSTEAQQIDALVKSKPFADKLKDNKKYILDNYDIGGNKMSEVMNSKVAKETMKANDSNEKIFIVISSSMPDSEVREYFKIAENKENVSFILRGLIGGVQKFEPTRKYLEKIIKKYPLDANNQEAYNVALSINPKVTQKYNIQKVPAVIYIKNYDGQVEKSEAMDRNTTSEEFWVSYGMASLEYVIEQINKEAKSQWLETLFKKDTFFNKKD